MRFRREVYKRLFWILFFNLGYIYVFAQTYQLTPYHTDNGLPTNLMKAVIQDNEGFVWASSDEGFSRFDGKNFINIKNDLPTNYTKSLFISKKEELFVITDLGILKVENNLKAKPKPISFLKGVTSDDDPSKTMYPKKIFEDCQNNFWISEPNSLLKYKNGKSKRYKFEEKYRTNIYLRSFEILEFNCKNLIASTFTGYLLKYNSSKDKFEEIKLPQKFTRVSANLKIDNQTIWLGTGEGIFEVKFDEKFEVTSVKKIANLPDVSYLIKDKNDNVLIGTWHDGLFKIAKNNLGKLTKIKASKAKVVNHLYLDKEDNVWVSSDDGLELLKPNFFHDISLSGVRGYIEDVFCTQNQDILASDGINLFKIKNFKDSLRSEVIYANSLYNIRSVCQFQKEIVAGLGNGSVIFLEEKQVKKTLNLTKYGEAIFLLYPDKNGYIWVCQYGKKAGVTRIDANKTIKYYGINQNVNSVITAVTQAKDGTLYFGGRGKKNYLYQYNYEEDRFENISIPINVKSNNTLIVNDIVVDDENNVWLASNLGLWKKTKNKVKLVKLKKYTHENIKAIEQDKNDSKSFWIGTNLGVIKYKENAFIVFQKNSGLSTVTTSLRGIVQNEQGNLYIATADGLNYSEGKVSTKTLPKPKILSLEANKVLIKNLNNLRFYNNVNLELQIQTFTYPNEFVMYQYRVVGLNEEWSEPSFQNQITIQRIPYGNYTLEVRAKEQGSFEWSKTTSLSFHVKIPWHLTWWAIILYLTGATVLILLLVYANTYRLKKQKDKLQDLVNKRTYQLEEKAQSLEKANSLLQTQKEEIRIKNEDLALQQKTLRSAFREIERSNKKMTDSLRYAKTMQEAMLPEISKIERFTQEHFIIYKPKDVVSGDFYWTTRFNNGYLLAVSDCTGHGVPGAMMSMIGNDLLYRIVKLKQVTDPAKILEHLHQEVRLALRQKHSNNTDGMDILLTYFKPINETQWEMTFAGAKRPLLYVKNNSNKLCKIKGSRKAIGGMHERPEPFENHIINLEKGDTLYLMSDGFIDQNDKERRKFGSKKFEKLVTDYANIPLKTQKTIFKEILEEHQKDTDQRDDITLLVIRL